MAVLQLVALMAKYVGLAWASNGWLGVILRDDDSWETDHFPTMWSLWKHHNDAACILIDVPIGLPSDHRRACDVEAKRKLTEQGRRIFYTPIREAVYEQNLEDAKEINEEAGYSIQNQAWRIVPRIREVDEFFDMNPGARDRVFETDPELCFYSLNGHEAVPPKKTDRGLTRRKALLADAHTDAESIYEEACARYLSPKYASFLRTRDDILDAMVAAVTARRDPSELTHLPERGEPPRDSRGLPMQMVYPNDVNQTRLSTVGETTQGEPR
jgi:predicted RNase H-like nuclease